MISHRDASARCKETAEEIRSLLANLRGDLADNPYWASDHPGATEDDVYASGTAGGLGGEAGDFAAFWTPSRAAAVADMLENAAVLLGALPDDVELPSQLSFAVRICGWWGALDLKEKQ